MKAWDTIDDLFSVLNASDVPYIILRNYEEIEADNFYTSGHADIDFLTSDAKRFAALLEGKPRFGSDDGIHYVINVAGTEVVIDVRHVGDGYYDKKWERSLLAGKVMHDGRFFVSDSVNYYYTLIYHAILQKKALADDYLSRLNQMAAGIGCTACDETGHLAALEQFMKRSGYKYTYPYDVWVPLRTELLDKSMVRKPLNVRMRNCKAGVLCAASKVKHKLLGR